MIITRSPLRIPLAGGGTDLPSYYRAHGGRVISAAIDKYVYLTLHETFVDDLIVKYSKLERVRHADDLEHPIIREAFRFLGMNGRGLEITSMADIPAGTGLGSSGSFTTGLLNLLHAHRRDLVDPAALAAEACSVEIEMVGEPSGKQDQYISAFGGVTSFDFNADETVGVDPLRLPAEVMHNLEENLVLFFTGYTRASSDVLRLHARATADSASEMVASLHRTKELASEIKDALTSGDLDGFANLMNEHWESKRGRLATTNPDIDAWYALGMQSGAIGGKLVGAGGGGFLLFYTEEKRRLRRAMTDAGLRELRFVFDFEGSRVLIR